MNGREQTNNAHLATRNLLSRFERHNCFAEAIEMVKVLTLEELYERQIKPRPKEERLRLLAMIAQDLAAEAKIEDQPKHSLMELEGLGAEIWQGIDAQEYVNELRKEWDHRP